MVNCDQKSILLQITIGFKLFLMHVSMLSNSRSMMLDLAFVGATSYLQWVVQGFLHLIWVKTNCFEFETARQVSEYSEVCVYKNELLVVSVMNR